MARLNLFFKGLNQAIRAIERRQRVLERIRWRALTRARNDLVRHYRDLLRQEIDGRTTRRSGRLRRNIRIKTVRNRRDAELVFFAQFPRTAYVTPRGRGRPGASKQGQYAFVVNNRVRFIQAANLRMLRSEKTRQILRKHLDFIVNEVNQGR